MFFMEAFMKCKVLFSCVCSAALWANLAFADTYQSCLDNAQDDYALINCTNQEAARILRTVNSKLATMASNPYFAGWDNPNLPAAKNFQNFLDQWVIFRTRYCTLLAYTQSQGKGTIAALNDAQCSLDMTKRLKQDIDAVMSSYTENNPQ